MTVISPTFQMGLRSLGADWYDLKLPESHALPRLLHPGEIVLGVVYGRYKLIPENLIGRGMLVATDQRLLLIDKKPLYLKFEESDYAFLRAVMYGKVGPATTIVVTTRAGNITLRTFNFKCTQRFVEALEGKIINPP